MATGTLSAQIPVHETAKPTVSRDIGVWIGVGVPEPSAGELGLSFVCSRPLELELEDAIVARVRHGLERTIQKIAGGIPPGGLRVELVVQLPVDWPASLDRALPENVAHVAAESLRMLLTSPSSPIARS